MPGNQEFDIHYYNDRDSCFVFSSLKFKKSIASIQSSVSYAVKRLRNGEEESAWDFVLYFPHIHTRQTYLGSKSSALLRNNLFTIIHVRLDKSSRLLSSPLYYKFIITMHSYKFCFWLPTFPPINTIFLAYGPFGKSRRTDCLLVLWAH